MNIRDLNSSTNRPDRSRSGSVGTANKVSSDSASSKTSDVKGQNVEDSVEISGAARAAQSDEQVIKEAEITFARKAMLSVPPLDDEKVEDILKRIQEGYYSPPEILKKITEKTADFLMGKKEVE